MRAQATLLAFVCAMLAVIVAVRAQQPAKQINTAPLDHPQPLTSVRTGDVARVMTQLRDAATASGFAITRTDNNRLTLEVRRVDRPPSRDYDRVLIWLERSPTEPTASVDLYLAYGRYEAILARTGTEVFRVVVPVAFEDERLKDLKPRLIALGN
jgi:hypothetical protein